MRTKRNVTDVSYVASDLTATPMRTVLRTRKSNAKMVSAKIRYEAFKARAGIIGVLNACHCAYPLEAEHREWCPSVALLRSQQAVKEKS